MKKKIALITGSHLSSNPRLVKEANALLEAGFKVSIVCVQHLSYLSEFDKEIFNTLAKADIHIINYENIGLGSKYLRYLSALRLKLEKLGGSKFLSSIIGVKYSRMLPEMKNKLKKIKADLYIGHTLAALPAVAWASKYHHSKYAFDAEDFHRGESNIDHEQKEVLALEDQYFPNSTYISTASPLTTDNYLKFYPKSDLFTINNVFPLNKMQSASVKETNVLKIVWFSQTIGLNRGLQEFLKALAFLPSKDFELHLRGTHSEAIQEELLNLVAPGWHSKIFFYPQCSPVLLEKWLQHFDVGLALENKETYNRIICITNKIFQYITAGLAVIATDTEGQKWVLKEAPNIGLVVNKDKMEIAIEQLKYWSENPDQLKITKQNSYKTALTKFNWDIEKKIFLQKISSICNS